MIKSIKQIASAELLALSKSINRSVHGRDRGNSVIRFRWPAIGTLDSKGQDISQQRAVSTGQKSAKISKDEQDGIIAAWFMENGFIPKPVISREGAADLESEIEEYIRTEYGNSPDGTVRPIRQALRRLREVLAKGWPEKKIAPIYTVQGITMEVFRLAVPELRKREKAPRPGQSAELKPKAWKNLFGNIHPFIEWEMEIERGNLTADPTLGTVTPTKAQLKKSRPIRKEWPDKEYEATLAKISFRNWKLLKGEGHSAEWAKLTKFTVKLLRWGGVDVNETYRLLAHHITEDSNGHLWIKKIRGKSKAAAMETIKLPVSSKLEKELREYWQIAMEKGPETPLLPWHTRFGTHESFRSWIWKTIQFARAKAGLPPRDVKSFRHTFTTYHLKRGKVKLSQLREWLGHADDSRMIEDTYDLSEHGTEAMD
jgi:integrase